MAQINIKRQKKYSLLFLTIAFLMQLSFAADTNAFEIIANKGVIEESLTVRELRAIFSLRLTKWHSTYPITLVVLAENDESHSRFCKDVLSIFPHQLRSKWDLSTYSGTGQAPIVASSQKEVIRIISETPGAIGYIDGVLNGDISNEPIKVIKVVKILESQNRIVK